MDLFKEPFQPQMRQDWTLKEFSFHSDPAIASLFVT
jgi:hypothetical protein